MKRTAHKRKLTDAERERRHKKYSSPSFPPSKTPTVPATEYNKPELNGLNTTHIRDLMHNAVIWCDHGGTIIVKDSSPFSSRLAAENNNDQGVEAGFHFQTSPYSNGDLSVYVWQDRELVLAATDQPGPVYRYPSKTPRITTYVEGAWEKFLMQMNYHKNEKDDR